MVREINNHLAMTDINLYLSHQEEAQLNKHMKANKKLDEAKEDRVRYHNKYLYRVFNESFDYGDRLGFGLGMSALHHSESFTNYSLSQINFNYAHRVNLNNGWYFRPALELGIGYKDFAFGNLLLSDQININTGAINSSSIDPSANLVENIFFLDISTGYVFERKTRNGVNYWIGISAKPLNRPNISFVNGENLPLDIFYSLIFFLHNLLAPLNHLFQSFHLHLPLILFLLQ